MGTRPPTWMFVTLGSQFALAVAGVLAVTGLANAMSAHAVGFAHDDVPMLFPAMAVVLLGALALLSWRHDRRALARIATFAPFPVAAVLMVWAWS